MDDIIRRRMYNIYQGQIPLINGAQIPVQYNGKIYGSGFVDLPGSKQYIKNDGDILDFNDWAEMIARQLAASNANLVQPTSDEQTGLFDKIKNDPNDTKSIKDLIASLRKTKGGKLSKKDRIDHIHDTYGDLRENLAEYKVHPRRVAEIFFDGYQRSGLSMKDLYTMLNQIPHIYENYQYY